MYFEIKKRVLVEESFWKKKWEDREIGFHQTAVNPMLEKYIHKLSLKTDDTVFVPLCGKSMDMQWLLSKGYSVIGCELIESAVEEFFAELKIDPEILIQKNYKIYQTDKLCIYVGDFFKLNADIIGPVDAVFDRAALVALPTEMRKKYYDHLSTITDKAKQLLITFSYDQNKLDGPPFSIEYKELQKGYNEYYQIKNLESYKGVEKLKGVVDIKHEIWLLLPLN